MAKKIRVELEANQSLSIEYPMTEAGDPMFAKLYLWYRSSGMFKKVSAGGFKVLGYLLMCADFEGHDCYPSLATIGRETGLSKPTVVKAIAELERLRLIVKHNRAGDVDNGTISNYYTIIQPPRAGLQGGVKNIDRVVKNVDRGGKESEQGGVKNIDTNKNTENKSQLTRNLIQKKNDRGFCVGEEDGRMGGMVDGSREDGLVVVEAFLSGMGLRRGAEAYAREIIDNGLTIDDMKVAAKIACYQVAKGNTEVSGYLGGIEGVGEWTPQLQQDALKYMRGVIRKCIRKKIPVKMSEQMAADMGDESEWMNKMVVARG